MIKRVSLSGRLPEFKISTKIERVEIADCIYNWAQFTDVVILNHEASNLQFC